MMICTNAMQLCRAVGVEKSTVYRYEGLRISWFPDYPPAFEVPPEVLNDLIELFKQVDVNLEVGRDWINDDGGYVIICSGLEDFEALKGNKIVFDPYGVIVEGCEKKVIDGITWVNATYITNNETAINIIAREVDIPDELLDRMNKA